MLASSVISLSRPTDKPEKLKTSFVWFAVSDNRSLVVAVGNLTRVRPSSYEIQILKWRAMANSLRLTAKVFSNGCSFGITKYKLDASIRCMSWQLASYVRWGVPAMRRYDTRRT